MRTRIRLAVNRPLPAENVANDVFTSSTTKTISLNNNKTNNSSNKMNMNNIPPFVKAHIKSI